MGVVSLANEEATKLLNPLAGVDEPEIRDALDGLGLFFGVTLLFATLIQWAAEHPELRTWAFWIAKFR